MFDHRGPLRGFPIGTYFPFWGHYYPLLPIITPLRGFPIGTYFPCWDPLFLPFWGHYYSLGDSLLGPTFPSLLGSLLLIFPSFPSLFLFLPFLPFPLLPSFSPFHFSLFPFWGLTLTRVVGCVLRVKGFIALMAKIRGVHEPWEGGDAVIMAACLEKSKDMILIYLLLTSE